MFKITASHSGNYIFESVKRLVILFAILMYSCNAPRNNPIDPENPGPSFSVIEGNVSTSYIPLVGIPDVMVHWMPADKFVKTDINGDFRIDNIRPVDGDLILSAEGYRSDTLLIRWSGGQSVSRQIHLNRLPEMEYIKINTSVEYDMSGRSAEVHIAARVIDRDSRIDSVYMQNAGLSFKKRLEMTGEEYSLIIKDTDLNVSSLESVVGEDFILFASDSLLGNSYKLGTGRIIRVIYYEPSIVYPINGNIIPSVPVLYWNRTIVPYNFSYLIEIFTSETGNNELVYTSPLLNPDITLLDTQLSLSAGEYFWVLWIIDQYNNRARSRPAIFVVQ